MSLPYGYEPKQTKNGRYYFVNHNTKTTTWTDPRPLPRGWDMKLEKGKNKPYFVDHIKKKTQWTDPRPPPKMPAPRSPLYLDYNKIPLDFAKTMVTQGREMLCSVHNNPAEKRFIFTTNLQSSRGGKLFFSSPHERREEENHCIEFGEMLDIYICKRPDSMLPKKGHCFTIRTNAGLYDFEMGLEYQDDYNGLVRGLEQTKRNHTNVHRGTFPFPKKKVVSSIQKSEKHSKKEIDQEWYKDVLKMALLDRNISKTENELVEKIKRKLNISEEQHSETLESFGWSLMEYHDVNEEQNPHHEIPTYTKKECCVCLDAEATYIILDCMHLCLCGDCADLFKSGDQTCPSCREPIKDVRQTYS